MSVTPCIGRKASLIFNMPNVNFFVFYGVIPNKKIANYNINYFGGGVFHKSDVSQSSCDEIIDLNNQYLHERNAGK